MEIITIGGHDFPAPQRVNTGDGIGDYYSNKDTEARHWRELLKTEEDPERRKIIQGRLAMAEYVGD